MQKLQICNFCELFGFSSRLNPVSRLPLKIDDKVYPAGFEFVAGTQLGTTKIDISLDELVLVYYDNTDTLVLHMFVPDGKAASTFVNCTPETKIYRYSKLEYLIEARETGRFRISPALEYIKNEYDPARQDNEHVHEKILDPETITIHSTDNTSVKPIGDVVFSSIHLPIDSYILCFSYDYDEGLYDEFSNSDACLVVHDVEEFSTRLHTAFGRAMPSLIGINHRVTYGKHESSFGVLFSKPKRYLYQREYRFSWIPDSPTRLLHPDIFMQYKEDEIRSLAPDPIEIFTGPLNDITSLTRRN